MNTHSKSTASFNLCLTWWSVSQSLRHIRSMPTCRTDLRLPLTVHIHTYICPLCPSSPRRGGWYLRLTPVRKVLHEEMSQERLAVQCCQHVSTQLTIGMGTGQRQCQVPMANACSSVLASTQLQHTTADSLPTFRGDSWHWYGLKLTELVNHRSISSPYISKSPWQKATIIVSQTHNV